MSPLSDHRQWLIAYERGASRQQASWLHVPFWQFRPDSSTVHSECIFSLTHKFSSRLSMPASPLPLACFQHFHMGADFPLPGPEFAVRGHISTCEVASAP